MQLRLAAAPLATAIASDAALDRRRRHRARRSPATAAQSWLLVALAFVLLSGCYRDNPAYDPDAGPSCSTSADCRDTGDRLVCDIGGSLTCVQCNENDRSACKGEQPLCGPDNTCVACAAHSDCAGSQLCLPSGACAAEADVAYVTPDGMDSASCGARDPCRTTTAALSKRRPYLKVSGEVVGASPNGTTIENQDVTIFGAPGARLKRLEAGAVLEVRGTSVVEVRDLEIAGGLGINVGYGVLLPQATQARVSLIGVTIRDNTGAGVLAAGGDLVITRSRIEGNRDGGISLSQNVAFDITNTFIVLNSTSQTVAGGLSLFNVGRSKSRFEFNTVARNTSMGTVAGVSSASLPAPVVFANNIVYDNGRSTDPSQVTVDPMVQWTYSNIGPNGATGTNNSNVAPDFLPDFHLSPTSPLRDTADPAATLSVDFDKQQRPQGARRDMGADELMP